MKIKKIKKAHRYSPTGAGFCRNCTIDFDNHDNQDIRDKINEIIERLNENSTKSS